MFPAPEIDSHSDVPLYRQVFQHVKDSINDGRLVPGARLPATRELAGLLGLNRTTVSAAYELLESEGLISGQVGRGSFVTGAPLRENLNLDWRTLLTPSASTPSPQPGSKEAISFAASRPSELLFPMDEFRRSCQEVLASGELASILQLGSPGGYGPLRQYLIAEARSQGAMGPNDDIIVTSGCQQALHLLQCVLAPAGTKVAIEDPIYPGVKNLFLCGGAQLAGVRMGPDGIDLQDLGARTRPGAPQAPRHHSEFSESHRRDHAAARAGRTPANGPRRRRRADRKRYLRRSAVRGRCHPALKSDNTILLRSYSKIAFPGLRVGWAIGPKAVIARMTEAKQLSDLHSDQLSQAVLLRFAESGRLEAHRQNILKAGAEKLKVVLSACERYLPAGSTFTRPEGGMNLWVRLPEPLDAGELLMRAQRENVNYLPGRYFTVSRPDPGGFRLSFAGLPADKIRAGVSILGEIFRAELERTQSAKSSEPAPAMV
jgi:Transcriptional regulators containing a DNA-binding HTH domain and an aminotransferase domain (MocR family) and their eukaryotic orthologs